jgi:tRNA(fMet)-specific endonuclease VapC
MPVRYLLDTNTVSYVIKGNFPRLRERLLRVPIREVGVSVVTEAELRFGVARLPHAAKLGIVVEEFLMRVEVLVWDSAAARVYARLRAALEESGEPMGNLEVSNNRVFRRVKGLTVEDWSRP